MWSAWRRSRPTGTTTASALSAAIAELDWVTEDDVLTDGDLDGLREGPVEALAGEHVSGADWSVQETLARVAAFPPGPQPIHWLTSLDGLALSPGEALAVAGAWERQARWVTARQQASWVGFAGPTGPGPLGPDGPTEAQLRQEHSNLLELALTIDCGVDFTRDQLDQARLLAGTLSATGDRLATGQLSAYRARRIAEELRSLDPVTARAHRDQGARHRRHGAGAELGPQAAPPRAGSARPGRGPGAPGRRSPAAGRRRHRSRRGRAARVARLPAPGADHRDPGAARDQSRRAGPRRPGRPRRGQSTEPATRRPAHRQRRQRT